MNPGLLDTHCHLDLEPLHSKLPRFMEEAGIAGVTGFVVPGVHPRAWGGIAALAVVNRQIFPAYGIHPMHADSVTEQVLARLSVLSIKGIAIGETGLDPAYPVPLDLQEQAFRVQLQMAVQRGLPVLIHCRQAFQRVLKVMREEGAHQVGGIMHAYSGSVEMAHDFIRLGFAIAISGTVTWNNAVKPLRVARELPLEHLVLETDAPDMTPQRYRGTFNRPAWIVETAQRIADIRGVAIEEVARITTDNARRVLRLESDSA
ncbi:MAG: TatD family hydrolase [Desulfuromonadaceae bacterium]